ncbi:MAG: acetyl-coenzyme A synthetase N-terminal domain-containing protein, partial [Phycisphaerae bacterium]
MSNQNIQSVLNERRTFPPPAAFSAQAHIKTTAEYDQLYRESIDTPQTFWPRMAEGLTWFKKWDTLLDWSKPPFAKWFVGGKINIAYNCLDRHAAGPRKDKTALLWEGEPGEVKKYTYAELTREVCRFANVLLAQGIKTGDVVAIYMPMIPEAAIAMLACARVGAVH